MACFWGERILIMGHAYHYNKNTTQDYHIIINILNVMMIIILVLWWSECDDDYHCALPLPESSRRTPSLYLEIESLDDDNMVTWWQHDKMMMTRQKDMIWTRTENQGGEGSCGWCSVDWRWTQLSWTARSGRRLTPWALQYFSYNRGRQYFQQFFNCVSIQQECHANHNYHSPGSSRLRNWDVSELFVIYIWYFLRIRWCVFSSDLASTSPSPPSSSSPSWWWTLARYWHTLRKEDSQGNR